MTKSHIAVFILLILVSTSLVAVESEPLSSSEISQVLSVLVDCLSASFASNLSTEKFDLPNSTVSNGSGTDLPVRVSYFLADPSEFSSFIGNKLNSDNSSFFSSILNLLSKSVQDPLLSAAYLSLASHNYQSGDYYLSGAISFTYPEGSSLESFEEIWYSGIASDKDVGLVVNIMVYGNKLAHPVSVVGNFRLSLEGLGTVIVRSVGYYMINEFVYENGVFTF
ncbi:MAG: hypothetical protein HUK24_06445 [Sphaerochaetaceae bacterium]|nr:hypothetical protein [Sphaerochaetaceae bacterium]